MCGRFTQFFTWAEIHELYRLMDDFAAEIVPSWNVAPASEAGVVLMDRDRLRYRRMRWGLVPSWAKDPAMGAKLINARSESLAQKPAFRQALRKRRCVIPLSGFYEWQRQGRVKQPFFVTSTDGRPLAAAGLWERWNELLSFTIITVPSNEAVSAIHDRMPAILSADGVSGWLSGGGTSLLQPCPSGDLAFWPISKRVNSPVNNDSGLIEREPAPQAVERKEDAGCGQYSLAL